MLKKLSKLLLGFLLFSILLGGCATTSKTKSDVKLSELKPLNPDLYRLEANCAISSSMNSQTFNFRVKVNIAGTDTVSMIVYGPFGITVGRLYSDLNYFQFHNIMENSLYKGSPTQENIKKATNLSISIKDFLNLFQGKTPFNINEYSVLEDSGESLILKRVDAANFGDFAVIGKSDYRLNRYQRKDKGDILILDSSFDKYKSTGNIAIPGSINFLMPTVDGKMLIEVDDYKINQNAGVPVKFDIPSSVKIIDLNAL